MQRLFLISPTVRRGRTPSADADSAALIVSALTVFAGGGYGGIHPATDPR